MLTAAHAGPADHADTVIDTIRVGDRPHHLAFTPDGTCAYVSHGAGNGQVSVIDTTTNTVTDTIDLGPSPYDLAISPNGTHAYVTLGRGTVSVVDTTTNTVVETVTVSKRWLWPGQGWPLNLAISPDGTLVYVTQFDGDWCL
ncbi:YncE family protein [Rhodococcus spongiicola]|uniref:YncE family protein n=1 Tax=Rhodococcus spongiicola TaxID=2487352 RepID=A0A3S3ZHG0_9NOCA|nr:hypothetical protein [Rhodococcus spongiicola]RVW00856.1 hypothetical protein EF834_15800 [Rhodococcus spongiicola]